VARAFSGPETDQLVFPRSSAVDVLGSLVSGEPYELFKLDWCPVEPGSFRCGPVVDDASAMRLSDDGDGNLVDADGAIVGGISYGYSNEDGGRLWLLCRIAALAPDSVWRCRYRYQL